MLRRTLIISALVVAGLILMVGAAFGIDRAVNRGEIMGRVSALGVDLGGLGEDDARARLEALQRELAATPVPVSVAGKTFELIPSEVGYRIDVDSVIEEAFRSGREGNWLSQFAWWVKKMWGGERILDVPATYDAAALDLVVEAWETTDIDDPPFPGTVEVLGLTVRPEYPRAGTGIDREAATTALGAALTDPSRPPVGLPTRPIAPPLTREDIDAVADRAQQLLSAPVTLRSAEYGVEIEIPRTVLAASLSVARDDTGEVPAFEFTWDDDPIQGFAAPLLESYRTEPRNAEIVIDSEDNVVIVPSLPVRSPDLDALGGQVAAALGSVTRIGPLAFEDVEDAEFSTADAEALGIKEKISEFTTYHPCCESRVVNIQLIADAVDGVILMPGETFSVNKHVGQRTAEKGYVRAGAIIGGYLQCCDHPANIGGGTSQFSTTLYNAIFYAGLEDVYHMPHTIYFSRYPEGIEATMGYPTPDVVFRNPFDAAVLIKTEHTGTSITVKVFGDNGGITVESEVSERFNFSRPITAYEVNDELDHCKYPSRDRGREKEKGTGGWSVRVYRHITYPDGERTTEEWSWHYRGSYRVIEYNPKKPPGGCNGDPPEDPED